MRRHLSWHRAAIFIFCFPILAQYGSVALRAQDTSQPPAIDSAKSAREARISSLNQQLSDLKSQGFSQNAGKIADVQEHLLTAVGEQQEDNRQQFERSKGLFSSPSVFQIPIMYVTDRQRSPQGGFSSVQSSGGSLEYGSAITTVKSDYALRTDFVVGALKLGHNAKAMPPATHILAGFPALLAEISAKKLDNNGKPRRLLLFIHGYNNSFDDAVEDAARLAAQVQFSVIPIAYSWPSSGTFKGYSHDEDQVRTSQVRFNRFLADLVAQSPVEVVIVAHSMGSRLLTEGLYNLSETNAAHPQLRHVIYAAADIAKEDFAEHWSSLKFKDVSYTLYSSNHDSALDLSYIVHSFQRLGDAKPSVIAFDGATSIDASAVDPMLKGVGHSYVFNSLAVASDLGQWVDTNATPKDRGLTGVAHANPEYYLFQ